MPEIYARVATSPTHDVEDPDRMLHKEAADARSPAAKNSVHVTPQQQNIYTAKEQVIFHIVAQRACFNYELAFNQGCAKMASYDVVILTWMVNCSKAVYMGGIHKYLCWKPAMTALQGW